jgi:hypothetical protein
MRTRIQGRIAPITLAFLVGTAAQADDPTRTTAVDPGTVGTWELPLPGGPWVWEIRPDGTYQFHSEAGDRIPPHAGTFYARNGQWSLKATTGYTDHGTYVVLPPDTLIARGQLGTAAWRHHALKPDAPKPASSELGLPQSF